MQLTYAQFVEAAQMIISEGLNGKVSVVALSFKGMGEIMPTSCPYTENVDRFNRPFYANDNLS